MGCFPENNAFLVTGVKEQSSGMVVGDEDVTTGTLHTVFSYSYFCLFLDWVVSHPRA
jgi:hypothetical protein